MIVGIIKPIHRSSFGMVAQVRRITRVKKVGHAGTLDPLATGVLVVAIGRNSTKKIPQLMLDEKEYKAEIRFGMYSSTDDSEGQKELVKSAVAPSKEIVEKALELFVGEIEQRPPNYSAIRVRGQRAYHLTRAGEKVNLKPRKVLVKSIDLISYEWPTATIVVTCGKGVYIRSIARDLGKRLGVGGYISRLDRTRVGNFDYTNCLKEPELEEKLPDLMQNYQAV